MKLRANKANAIYLNGRDSKAIKSSTQSRFALIFSVFLAFFVFASTLTIMQIDAKDYVSLAAEECNPSDDNCDFQQGIDKFEGTEDDLDSAKTYGSPPDGFTDYILWRLFQIGYMNDGREAVIGGGDDPRYAGNWNCSTDEDENKLQGTLLYHNCDVPNFLTGVVQNFAETFIPTGPQGANQESAYAGKVEKDEGARPWGLSYYTPKNVNVDYKIKYTALELYGYNMKYTSYGGEWDSIEVYTSARALAGFSTFDKVKLIFKTAVASIGNFASGAFCGITGGLLGGCDDPRPPSSKILMDTSDTNVFTQNSWFRPNFGATMYGVRELSEAEVSDLVVADLIEEFDTQQVLEKYPEFDGIIPNLSSLKNGECSWAKEDAPNSIRTRKDCYDYFKDYPQPPDNRSAVDFIAPETLEEWKDRVWGDAASKYNLCNNINTNIGWDDTVNAEAALDSITQCVKGELVQKYLELAAGLDVFTTGVFAAIDLPADVIAERIAKQKGKYLKPHNRYICLDEDNNDRVNAGASGRDYYVFLYSENGTDVNPKCYDGGRLYRAPIQDGFYGNGYVSEQSSAQLANIVQDPRHDRIDPSFMETVFRFSPTGKIADLNLAFAKLFTKMSNTVLNLALSPILDSLGITDIMVEMIESLRDSIFYPLIALAVAFGGIWVFAQTLRQRNYLQQIQSIVLLILTFILGVAILESPRATINVVDKGPAWVESVIVGTIFEVGSDDRDNVCKASDASEATAVKGWEGEDLPFNPEASSRVLLCENWRVFLLNPYVYGQWGTSYSNLDAEQMQNDNENLVGRPIVRLGGANEGNSVAAKAKYWEENWAMYQLDTILTGTTTTPDSSNPNDAVSRDFYRIVDMQAHPAMNFDKLTVGEPDSRYFEMWSGARGADRAFIAFLTMILAFMGLFVVTAYSFLKITVTILSALMLVFLPFIFLIGVIPGGGRTRMKKYFGDILSLMFQRVMLTVLLAMMMRTLAALADSSNDFFMYFILAFAVCLLFMKYREELIGLFTKTTKEAVGDWRSMAKNKNGTFINRSVDQKIRSYKMAAGGIVTGTVGGFAAGGFAGAGKGAGESLKIAQRRSKLKDQREGTGLLRGLKQAGEAGSAHGSRQFDKYKEPGQNELKSSLAKKVIDSKEFKLDDDVIRDTIDANTRVKGVEPADTTSSVDKKITDATVDRRDITKLGKAAVKRSKDEAKLIKKGRPEEFTNKVDTVALKKVMGDPKKGPAYADLKANLKNYEVLAKENKKVSARYLNKDDERIKKIVNKIEKQVDYRTPLQDEEASLKAQKAEAERMAAKTFANTDSVDEPLFVDYTREPSEDVPLTGWDNENA